MRTTLNLDEELMEKIMRNTGIKSKTKIINNALQEYFYKIISDSIKDAWGKLDFDLDVREFRNLELDEV
jgi:Arc/MetJ family transcription regulator